MSGGAPTTSGGMSAGTGTTTPVSSGLSRLAPPDQSVLCSAICKCQATPGIGKDGRKLNQVCVSSRLKELDKVLQGRSPYKPEVNYDMTQEPPEPIMNSEDATQPHGWLRGWIDKYWGDPDKDRPEWKASRGYVRRPDVVIVNDPTISPTQDNIRMVVEIKFPNDDPGTGQMKAYERIAGSEAEGRSSRILRMRLQPSGRARTPGRRVRQVRCASQSGAIHFAASVFARPLAAAARWSPCASARYTLR